MYCFRPDQRQRILFWNFLVEWITPHRITTLEKTINTATPQSPILRQRNLQFAVILPRLFLTLCQ